MNWQQLQETIQSAWDHLQPLGEWFRRRFAKWSLDWRLKALSTADPSRWRDDAAGLFQEGLTLQQEVEDHDDGNPSLYLRRGDLNTLVAGWCARADAAISEIEWASFSRRLGIMAVVTVVAAVVLLTPSAGGGSLASQISSVMNGNPEWIAFIEALVKTLPAAMLATLISVAVLLFLSYSRQATSVITAMILSTVPIAALGAFGHVMAHQMNELRSTYSEWENARRNQHDTEAELGAVERKLQSIYDAQASNNTEIAKNAVLRLAVNQSDASGLANFLQILGNDIGARIKISNADISNIDNEMKSIKSSIGNLEKNKGDMLSEMVGVRAGQDSGYASAIFYYDRGGLGTNRSEISGLTTKIEGMERQITQIRQTQEKYAHEREVILNRIVLLNAQQSMIDAASAAIAASSSANVAPAKQAILAVIDAADKYLKDVSHDLYRRKTSVESDRQKLESNLSGKRDDVGKKREGFDKAEVDFSKKVGLGNSDVIVFKYGDGVDGGSKSGDHSGNIDGRGAKDKDRLRFAVQHIVMLADSLFGASEFQMCFVVFGLVMLFPWAVRLYAHLPLGGKLLGGGAFLWLIV